MSLAGNSSNEIRVEPLELTAADGCRVGATRFVPPTATRAHLVVAGATGVPQGFYRRFAEYAARRGFAVLTLDYRGVGRSKPTQLRDFKADYFDWAQRDLAAAVDAMASERLPLYMVGHSFGGHAFGLLPNHRRVAGFYTFGTGAGWHGWMPWAESLRVRFLWNVTSPILVAWKGYAPMSLIGGGEDLPLGVYRQWRRWCRFPHYFFDDPEQLGLAERYAEVKTPIVAANALDDLWASPCSRDAFMRGYRNAPLTRVDLDPREFGGWIGHLGYFRQEAQALWDGVLAWFAAGAESL